MMTRIVTWFVLLACGTSGAAFAQTLDPHRIYEQKCGACHAAHAGDFAWVTIALSDGVLVGKDTGRPIRALLESGHGRLAGPEIEAVLEQFRTILMSDRLFRKKCRICHTSAVELARRELILTDGQLKGRYTGRDMADYLLRHGRLSPSEVETMLNVLTRALTTQEPPN